VPPDRQGARSVRSMLMNRALWRPNDEFL
jgi:hypothetical protein